MNRRTFVVGGGSIGAATIGGVLLAGTASAEVEAGLFSVEEYAIDTNSGRLETLAVTDISAFAEWSGFEYRAREAEWTLTVTLPGDDPEEEVVGTVSAEIGDGDVGDTDYEGRVETTMESFDLVEIFGQERFEVPSDYNDSTYEERVTKAFDVEFALEARVTDDGGNEVTGSATGDSVVEITNEGATVETGGRGEFDAEEQSGSDPPSDAVAILRPGDGDTFDAGETIEFEGTNGEAHAFEWDFDDGTERDGATVERAYDDPGSYAVVLTAFNPAGNEVGSDSIAITIDEG